MQKTYEIYFYLQLQGDFDFDLSLIPANDYFIIDCQPIGTVSKYTRMPSEKSYLKLTSSNQGDEILLPLFDFIEKLSLIEVFLLKYYNDEKVLYISQNYQYQCNFEISANLLGLLNKYNIDLAVSSYFIGKK